jgi:hypothetical protein
MFLTSSKAAKKGQASFLWAIVPLSPYFKKERDSLFLQKKGEAPFF